MNTERKWKKTLLFLGMLCFLAAYTGCGKKTDSLSFETEAVPEEAAPEEKTSVQEEPELPIYVDVSGAVNAPGVYSMKQGDRVFQAVTAAGGIREDAAQSSVNQARVLVDGEQIYIPTKEEMEQNPAAVPVQTESSGSGEQGLVDINTADEAALTTLQGIGESKARAILAYREAHGGFRSVEEIMEVEGIKENTFQKIKDQIVVR